MHDNRTKRLQAIANNVWDFGRESNVFCWNCFDLQERHARNGSCLYLPFKFDPIEHVVLPPDKRRRYAVISLWSTKDPANKVAVEIIRGGS